MRYCRPEPRLDDLEQLIAARLHHRDRRLHVQPLHFWRREGDVTRERELEPVKTIVDADRHYPSSLRRILCDAPDEHTALRVRRREIAAGRIVIDDLRHLIRPIDVVRHHFPRDAVERQARTRETRRPMSPARQAGPPISPGFPPLRLLTAPSATGRRPSRLSSWPRQQLLRSRPPFATGRASAPTRGAASPRQRNGRRARGRHAVRPLTGCASAPSACSTMAAVSRWRSRTLSPHRAHDATCCCVSGAASLSTAA